MEDRYEILGKIGQGGLGAVYRGYDARMNREIAIKRIFVASDDPTLQAESTRQLIKEAGALASLQHPHIVTIYDVGADEDGPYVIMELIAGKTLDELLERAPLTWNDFRELVLQSQEALIAAQELNLIHSDIKPSNLMLSWLPSGKFQLKIVDFGMATLNQTQALEEIMQADSVLGSIFFMAPEQFEQTGIDMRTDIYAMGCVYYQALTGLYPFNGDTCDEVINAHLNHQVIPIQDLRADLPLWACDWVMWMMNRSPADRPEDARVSLKNFLSNDKLPNPALSTGQPPYVPPAPVVQAVTPAGPPRSRLVVGGARLPSAANTEHAVVHTAVAVAPPVAATAQALLPPEGSKPSIYTSPIDITRFVPALIPLAEIEPFAQAVPSRLVGVRPAPRANTGSMVRIGGSGASTSTIVTPTVIITPSRQLVGNPSGASNGLKIMLAVAFCFLFVIGFLLVDRIKDSKASTRLPDILEEASKGGVAAITMTEKEVAAILQEVANASTDADRVKAINALILAEPEEGESDFDEQIGKYATQSVELLPEVREELISQVLAKRSSPKVAYFLIEFARSTRDNKSAVSAIKAVRGKASDEDFQSLIDLVQFHPNADLSAAAVEAAAELVSTSKKRETFHNEIAKILENTTNSRIRTALETLHSKSAPY